ncbi:beta-class carbonic anhydrase [Sulfobacillus thermosulfidooxidans]|uniref:beta-class carbonic anhydrase n=1 Tax=Sulfobacillus thermosulfidooxidans TaxID=28034 RepID=UPI0006B5CE58|nr:carbonic anhydrase [Sulfobacillus thermosulfidooxidans]
MLFETLDQQIKNYADWVLRRQRGIPNNRRLFVVACMDERLPVEEALGIDKGDAHIFRNAGGLVTDDVIRSAMLTTNFFGTEEIIIVNHTECGMMSAKTEALVQAMKDKVGNLEQVALDPSLPELTLSDPNAFGRWIKMFDDVDEISEAQVKFLRNHPFIPAHVTIHSYVYEVETARLRKPHERLAEHVNDARTMIEHAYLA